MIHQIACFAIGLVYCTVFYRAVQRPEPCSLTERLRITPAEQYCHLALGILYPLSTIHG